MRFLAALAISLAALCVRAEPIGYDGARHLLSRTGFGATEAEIAEFAPLERGPAVDRILAGARNESSVKPPAFVDESFTPYYKLRALSTDERKAYQRQLVEQGFELRAWWLREMMVTPSPLTERMTLFWHNHFATSQQKVRSGQLMFRQNVLLRREALGNFSTLLHEIGKDPAMLVWLDNAGSRKQAPNENFAREVMELFTLGEGHYGERDVKEAARAFTGWSLDRETGTFMFRPAFHDFGEKTVLGRTGRLDGDDVLDVLLAQPATARFISTKLWREFVSPDPDPVEVDRWAAVFRDSRYRVKPLLRAILMSDAFWAPQNRAVLVKSPVELVVGTLRTFGIHPFDLRPAVFACAALGQNPFSPPNVKGWPGGDAWITSATLLARKQWIDRVFRGSEPAMTMASDAAPANTGGAPGEQRYRRMLERGMSDYAFDESRVPAATARVTRLALAVPPVNSVSGLEGDTGARARCRSRLPAQMTMTFDRRRFLQAASLAAFAATARISLAAEPRRKLLVLVELKGGNDGLNTVIPYSDPQYAALRPRLAISRDQVVQLTESTGLHPSLAPLKPLWDRKELALVQGVGYPQPNLSHFRSIEIWDTASKSDEYLDAGWLARAFAMSPSPASFAADGVVVGPNAMGPLSGPGVRAIALTSPEQFLRNARLAHDEGASRNPALAHILKVEHDVTVSAERLHASRTFAAEFPRNPFGNVGEHGRATRGQTMRGSP